MCHAWTMDMKVDLLSFFFLMDFLTVWFMSLFRSRFVQMFFGALGDCLVALSSCRHFPEDSPPSETFAKEVMDAFERQVSTL